MIIRNKKVLVIGAAVTGIPTVKQLHKMGAEIILNDFKKAEDIKDTLDQFAELDIRFVGGGHPVELAEQCDFVVISPGVPTDIELVKKAKALGKEVIGEIELAYRLTSTPIAAITGTNGKTTTTALLGEIMKASGRNTYVTGNIGHAMISEVDNAKPEDIFVLEVSSFQLESTVDFKPQISAILNITLDHLNRHKTMENYIDTKCKVFYNQDKDGYTILNKDDPETAKLGERVKSRLLKSKLLMFSRKEILEEGAFVEDGSIVIVLDNKKSTIVHIDEIYIPGNHNVENALAASLMAYCAGVAPEVIAGVLKEFKGVEHRIEFVMDRKGVYYYNDSKGTNPDASIKAIEAMRRPIVLIAGGMDKGSEFDEFVEAFGKKVKELVLFGETAEKLEQTARKHHFRHIHRVHNLEEAVKKCHHLAKKGDCVLLSPACASWDMFKNFEERGNMFKEYVEKL